MKFDKTDVEYIDELITKLNKCLGYLEECRDKIKNNPRQYSVTKFYRELRGAVDRVDEVMLVDYCESWEK